MKGAASAAVERNKVTNFINELKCNSKTLPPSGEAVSGGGVLRGTKAVLKAHGLSILVEVGAAKAIAHSAVAPIQLKNSL